MSFNFQTKINTSNLGLVAMSFLFMAGISVVFYCLFALLFIDDKELQKNALFISVIFGFIFSVCLLFLFGILQKFDERETMRKEALKYETSKTSVLSELADLEQKEIELGTDKIMHKI